VNVAMARVALDPLKRQLDVLTIAFQHLGERASIEDEAAGDTVQGIVAPRGFEDAIHLCRYLGQSTLNAIAAAVNEAIEIRCHGINAVLSHLSLEA
jgi:hypothetical protein